MQLKGTLMILLASFLWGTTFVAQMTGMDNLGPFSYAASRFTLGFIFLLAVWFSQSKNRQREMREGRYKSGFIAGIGSGLFMFAASSLQQIAMLYTTAGKTAFITCLYIVIVPLGAIILGKLIRIENWIGAALALVGLYLLAIHEDLTFQIGDLIVFVSSFFWAAQILFIDRFASRVDALELSVAQIFVCMTLSFAAMMIFETPTTSAVIDAWFPIFYGGIMSAGVAFTLQVYGQKYAEPSTAAILMSCESIFGAVSSWILLNEIMTGREIFGCVLMFLGVLVTQIRSIIAR